MGIKGRKVMMATAAVMHTGGWVYEPYSAAGWGESTPCSSSRPNPPRNPPPREQE